MRRLRSKSRPRQSASTAEVPILAGDDGSATVALIQALLPLGLRAVEEALQQEVRALADTRYGRADGRPGTSRCWWCSMERRDSARRSATCVATQAAGGVRAGDVCGRQARARATSPRTPAAERLSGREFGGGTRGDADVASPRSLHRAGRELQDDELDRERHGATVSSGEGTSRAPLAQAGASRQTLHRECGRSVSRIIHGIACFSTKLGTDPDDREVIFIALLPAATWDALARVRNGPLRVLEIAERSGVEAAERLCAQLLRPHRGARLRAGDG